MAGPANARSRARRERIDDDRSIKVDCVEELAMDAGRVGIRPTVAKRVVCVSRLAGGDCPRSGHDFGQLAKVLGDGGEVEFIAGAIRAA
jgi:hypothetical protein